MARRTVKSEYATARSLTLNVSGDLLWHNTLWDAATIDGRSTGRTDMDFLPQLASLQSSVSRADLAVCHEEVPFAPQEGPLQNHPLFAAPPAVAEAIRAVGWDACTTASNHALDAGWEGLVRTFETLEDAGIRVIGTYATGEHASVPTIVETESGVRVGFVSQMYGLNGLRKPRDKDWAIQLIDPEALRASAARTRAIVTALVDEGLEELGAS